MSNKLINVLDHGQIRLVDSMGNDLSIVRNARCSYDAEWRAGKDAGSDERLIGYLLDNKHNTPFEAVSFTFDVVAPIFVLRQWHRHRTQSYNELSARYRPLPAMFYVPDPSVIGVQSSGNKQCRDISPDGSYTEEQQRAHEIMADNNQASFAAYEELLKQGVPRELARSVLPVSTYSHMFATVNLHNLFNFLRERLHSHAQYEIQVYARAMLELIEDKVPIAVQHFKNQLSQKEGYKI